MRCPAPRRWFSSHATKVRISTAKLPLPAIGISAFITGLMKCLREFRIDLEDCLSGRTPGLPDLDSEGWEAADAPEGVDGRPQFLTYTMPMELWSAKRIGSTRPARRPARGPSRHTCAYRPSE